MKPTLLPLRKFSGCRVVYLKIRIKNRGIMGTEIILAFFTNLMKADQFTQSNLKDNRKQSHAEQITSGKQA
jgi:hypothetical protein